MIPIFATKVRALAKIVIFLMARMKNLTKFERAVRLFLAVLAFFAVAVLLHHPVAKVIFSAFGILAVFELLSGKCWAYAKLGSEKLSLEKLYLMGLALIQGVMAYEWWSAGWEKISTPDFVNGINKTLGFFASQNPFPWYKNFLNDFALPNATRFAYTVEWSQIAIAIVLLVTAVLVLYTRGSLNKLVLLVAAVALIGGMLMNTNFYLAAGWTGPGTKGSNVVMFWTQAMLLYVWLSRLLNPRN